MASPARPNRLKVSLILDSRFHVRLPEKRHRQTFALPVAYKDIGVLIAEEVRQGRIKGAVVRVRLRAEVIDQPNVEVLYFFVSILKYG